MTDETDRSPHSPAATGAWEMVLIDQELLHRPARFKCKRAMTRLNKMRGRLTVFEREDKPAFRRWVAREFGPLLSRGRELDAQIGEKQSLLQEVESEVLRSSCDPKTAYDRVVYRRTHPSARNEEARVNTTAPPGPGFTVHLSDTEKEIIFQEFLRVNFGVNPEGMNGAAYTATFGNFRFHLFGETPEEASSAVQMASGEEEGGAIDPRLKELYRVLVRRLHPDIRADGDAGACALWHDVQRAYAARDMARMETLLALSDIESDRLDGQTSLFQIRSAWAELRDALRALRRGLRLALADEAWGFARREINSGLRSRVAESLEQELASKSTTLNYLTNTIAGWSASPQREARQASTADQPQFVS